MPLISRDGTNRRLPCTLLAGHATGNAGQTPTHTLVTQYGGDTVCRDKLFRWVDTRMDLSATRVRTHLFASCALGSDPLASVCVMACSFSSYTDLQACGKQQACLAFYAHLDLRCGLSSIIQHLDASACQSRANCAHQRLLSSGATWHGLCFHPDTYCKDNMANHGRPSNTAGFVGVNISTHRGAGAV